ncbi:tail fiber protein [Chitinophaga ginsengisoli]|uniref:Tail collar domain n=1 Tax=Chitinophaga ginsengisoli TaxID=363837 RepID=A0A2P8GLR2_9BACT|nr:tail fiber protein [Chitinophaga ginsengisoli]PSL34908.1 tail collar domain [Chitinophaga ginsengisoli]
MKHFLFITAFVCTAAISNLYAQTDALKILPNGNVGVGTDAPTEKLQVDGNVKANGRFVDKTGVVMPIGTVLPYAGTTPPPGWLLCDGTAYSISGDQKDLFAAIGYTHGSDGTTAKFRVPDLRGVFVMGAVPTLSYESVGTRGEADQHGHYVDFPARTLYTNFAGSHRHSFPSNWYKRNMDDGNYSGIDTGGSDVSQQTTQDAGNHQHSIADYGQRLYTNYTNDRNRPKWIALNYIIKY